MLIKVNKKNIGSMSGCVQSQQQIYQNKLTKMAWYDSATLCVTLENMLHNDLAV